jgi:type IX secretion system PorP/SprF family membrane protein
MRLAFIYILLIVAADAQAQHSPLFSQYMLNGLAINPAYTGSREVFTANAMYRNQWAGIEGAPKTQVLSIHGPLKNKSVAVGLLLNNEQYGVTKNTGITGNFAYRLKMRAATLSFGLSAGINLMSARYTELATTQANDLSFANDYRGTFRPDFGAGIYYFSKKYFVGLSVPTMTSQRYLLENEKVRTYSDFGNYNFILTGGYLFTLSQNFKLKPSSLIRITPNQQAQIDLNANVIYKDQFWLGMSYRHHDALVVLAEFQINQQFKIGYSYDYTLATFKNYSKGSHEIMLQYEFGFRVKSIDPRFF